MPLLDDFSTISLFNDTLSDIAQGVGLKRDGFGEFMRPAFTPGRHVWANIHIGTSVKMRIDESPAEMLPRLIKAHYEMLELVADTIDKLENL